MWGFTGSAWLAWHAAHPGLLNTHNACSDGGISDAGSASPWLFLIQTRQPPCWMPTTERVEAKKAAAAKVRAQTMFALAAMKAERASVMAGQLQLVHQKDGLKVL